jgi:biopolymer transport protein ExbB
LGSIKKRKNEMKRSESKRRRGLWRRPGPGVVSLLATLATWSQPALAQAPNPLLPHNLSPWGMFLNADIVVKVVMIGLALASLVTWTVWLAKTIELSVAKRLARRRLRMLESDGSLFEAVDACGEARDAVAQLITSTAREAGLSDGIVDDGFKDRVALRLERVEAAMTRRISRGVGILATIGATAPFVGLFGTVWGIMNSFIGISESHTTNLAVVAPGINAACGGVTPWPCVLVRVRTATILTSSTRSTSPHSSTSFWCCSSSSWWRRRLRPSTSASTCPPAPRRSSRGRISRYRHHQAGRLDCGRREHHLARPASLRARRGDQRPQG